MITHSGFTEVSDGRRYYETAGGGDAVVFVHGNFGDHRHWDRQFFALSDRLRVVRYDVIMTAEHDLSACREVADLLDQSIDESKKVVLSGTGHMLHMEEPEEFNKQLSEFLRAVRSQPGRK
jgi:pimeloyl-ACP methyl ester carboxylesterase